MADSRVLFLEQLPDGSIIGRHINLRSCDLIALVGVLMRLEGKIDDWVRRDVWHVTMEDPPAHKSSPHPCNADAL